jgi:hypothetical protein
MNQPLATAILCAVVPLLLLVPRPALPGTCIEGGCHESIVSTKYLHGPVAAEEAGVEGCASCHVPAGAACSPHKAGTYQFKTKPERLCLMCHEHGTGTQHTRAESRCLSCHSPHGSNGGNTLMRAG